jgi:predicted nucleic acid-binding protein
VEATTIITPTPESIFLVREFIDKHNLKGNKIFDAYLVATAMSNNIFSIATDNVRDFSIYKEIKVINPFQ